MEAAECHPIYNAVDPDTHHPVLPDLRFSADIALLANRLPDREQRVEDFFFDAATRLPQKKFLLGGAGWDDNVNRANVRYIGHVPTADHNAFNCTPRAVLNINRESMAASGYSPPTRIFEAAGAGACVITDDWPGIDIFLKPGHEILAVRDGRDLAATLHDLGRDRAREIGMNALARIRAEHTYGDRAREVDQLFSRLLPVKRSAAA
jgi:spore maturation protein CgeB